MVNHTDFEQEGTELIAEPEVAVAVTTDGFDIEVGTGEQALSRAVLDDREGHTMIGVAQLDERTHGDPTTPAARSLEVRSDAIHVQQEVGGVVLRA